MIVTILAISYLVFLCRGVPDSIIGAAWPLMYVEFDVPVSYVSILTIAVSLFTALASMLSPKVISRLGTFKTLIFSLVFMAVSVLGFGLGKSFMTLCLLSVPMGFCAGTLDSTLNNYLATRYKAVFLNLLHGFYGLGAILSPMLISMAITQKNNWREGYFLAFYILIGVWMVLMASAVLWKKAETVKKQSDDNYNAEVVSVSFIEQLRNKKAVLLYLVVTATNALEYSLGVWGSTFFTDSRSISPEIAATLITVLYAGMTVGRLTGAFLSIKVDCLKLVKMAIFVLAPVCLMLLFNLNIIALYVLMFVFGLANGPVYPLILSVTPNIVGRRMSQSVIGMEIAFAYTGCVLTHILLGILVEYFSIGVLPVFAFVSYILMIAMFIALWRNINKPKETNYDLSIEK